MRTTAAKYLLSFASALLFVTNSFGQNPVSYLNDAGSPAYATNIPVPNGYINLANGNLHLEVPLASPPQRGAVKVNERLVYDSRIWMFSPFGTHGSFHWWPYNIYGTSTTSGGWRLVTGGEAGSLSTNVPNWTSSGCQQPYYGAPWEYDGDTWYTQYYSWTDPSGMTHPFSATEVWEETDCWDPAPPTYSPGGATDGSPYYLSFDSYGNTIITGLHGEQVYPSVADRYGNGIGYGTGGNLVDDTGRTPVIATTSGSTTTYSVLAPNGSPGTGGTRVNYTATTAPVSVATSFGWSSGGNVIYEWIDPSDLQPIQSIQLPDGSQYTFNYDSYGEMTSMTLPTGGTVTFGYNNVVDRTGTPNRWVSSYQVGSNPATTFAASACGGGCAQYVDMIRPSGDETRYIFTINNGAWNTETDVFNGTSSWALLNYVANTYSNPCTSYPCSGPNYVTDSLSTTSLFSGGSLIGSSTETTFSGPGYPSAVKQWDFSAGATGTPTRETDYAYTTFGDPLTVTVKDSTGAQASKTTYGYTTSAAAPSPTPPMYYPSSFIVPTYLQTVTHWLNSNPSASPTTTITMDATGQVTSVQDPDGHAPTTTTYQCSNSLPQFVEPLGSATYKTTYGYDCASGAITNVQDPNGNSVGYTYEAMAGRLQKISYPDLGSTIYSYPSSTEVDTSIDASPDPAITSQTIVDSFGRPYETIQNGITATTSYDANGRVHCVDNPYAVGGSTSGQTCITSYDTLNRPLTKTLPDGSTQQWTYTVDTTAQKTVTTATDEAGAQTKSSSNALGQLKEVVEVGPVGNLTTNYTYDGLGNLTYINQQGLGTPTDSPRNRSFDYDSLSRLLCASNPENSSAACPGSVGTSYAYTTGTVGYGYDPNGNVASMEDARGITVSSTYDSLNRLLTKTASGINYQYTYDSKSGLPNVNSVGRLVYAWNGATAAEGFSYDSMGRVNWQTNWTPSNYAAPGTGGSGMTATYDRAGNMTYLMYPDGHHIHQAFNSAGQLTGINYADWFGTPVNYPYVSNITYSPLGGMSSIVLGNGVNESIYYNNRSQPCEIAASYPVTPGSSTMAFASYKQYYFSSGGTGGVCGTVTGNNGNVWSIADALAPTGTTSKTQNFTFDSLNRLTGSTRADNKFNYTYNMDSFGNMQQTNTLTYNPLITFGANNQIQVASAYSFDNAGNVTDTGSSSGGHHYTYDSLGQQTQVDYGTTGTYTYDALGARIRRDTNYYGWTEYVNFGGKTIGEWHDDNTWQDNIYANGQLVARDHSSDTYIHFTGTNSASGNWWVYPMPIPSGITIQSGSKLIWRQYQSGAAVPQGGIILGLSSGGATNWSLTDSQGYYVNSDPVQNQWHNRMADLTSLAGQTVTWADVVADAATGAGAWDEKLADIALVQPDGTVYTFYNNQKGGSFGSGWGTSGVSGQTFAETYVWNQYIPQETTHYFLADHLGSTRVEFAGGGWPVWGEDYAPYGQEVSTTGSPEQTSNIYKFTGYERDPETAIAAGTEEDYAQARYYSSAIQGRFMSPDPYMGSMKLANPQSFNRYTYAMNNPVKFSDPTGLECVWDDGSYDEAGDPQTGTDAGCEGQGGTYIPPDIFEGLEGNQPGSWTAPGDPSNSTIAFDFLTISSTVTAAPNNSITLDVPMAAWNYAAQQTTPVSCSLWCYGNYAGPGGMGVPINNLDAGAMIHDSCYGDRFSEYSNLTGYPNSQLQACNQQLCNTARDVMRQLAAKNNANSTPRARYLNPGVGLSPAEAAEFDAADQINEYFTLAIAPWGNSCH